MKLNEKIFENRKKLGLSQEDLANKLDVSRQTVSKWEVGSATPEVEKIVKLSDIFNVSVDYLVKEQNVEELNEKTEKKRFNKKKIIIGSTIIISIFVLIIIIPFIMFKCKINKRENEINQIYQQYHKKYGKIGITDNGRITETISIKEGENVIKEHRTYYFYADKTLNRKVKIEIRENYDSNSTIITNDIDKEVYIDLEKRKDHTIGLSGISGIYDDVVIVNLKDFSQEIIDGYEFRNPNDIINRVMTNRTGSLWAYNMKPDNFYEMAKDSSVKVNISDIKETFSGTFEYGGLYDNEKDNAIKIMIFPNTSYIRLEWYDSDITGLITHSDISISPMQYTEEIVKIPEY